MKEEKYCSCIPEQRKPRNANIELLRIIAMLFIVMGHFNGQAGFNHFSLLPNSIFITILGSGSRIAVNVFLIIGAWFRVDAKFSGQRIISIWTQVAFYTYTLTTLMIILSVPVSMKDIFRGYLPFIGRGLWFASAYITLMFAAPFLNKVFSWEAGQQRLLLIMSFAAICLVSTLPDTQEAYLCDSLWFWFVYLAIGYYKKEIFEKRRQDVEKWKWLSLVMGGGLYIGLCIALHLGTLYRGSSRLFCIIHNLAYQYISDIKTLPNILCAFLIFNFVILCKERISEFIQKIASASFSVYIVHQVPAFIQFLWKSIYRADMLKGWNWSALYMIFVAVSIYVVVFAVDMARRCIEKRWVHSSVFCSVEEKLDNAYRKAGMIE